MVSILRYWFERETSLLKKVSVRVVFVWPPKVMLSDLFDYFLFVFLKETTFGNLLYCTVYREHNTTDRNIYIYI